MKLYLLEPEVAGGIGEKTTFMDDIYQNGVKKISHLHYEFDGWLGDELLESTPYFIVTEEPVFVNIVVAFSYFSVLKKCHLSPSSVKATALRLLAC